ncbi:MAG: transposase [Saprospiraceae bacterium]|nr:transposase [Saprospiraceae bacterium]
MVRDNHQAQISTTDPDACALPRKMNIVEVSYNVQAAVEAENKLITNYEVTNENDTHALSGVALEAKAVLKKERIQALADKGYDTGSELKICAENNIETYVAPRQKNTSHKHPDFVKGKFSYDGERDSYTCPEGKELLSNGNWYKKNGTDYRKVYEVQVYKLPFEVCNACVQRLDCAGQANLNNSKGRPIERSEYDEYLEANRERVMLNKALYRTRQQIVEHPFGTIKRSWGYDYTLLKTKEKVGGEMALIFTCYNLRRSMTIFGVQDLLKRLKAACLLFFAPNRANLSSYKPFLFPKIKAPTFYFQNFYQHTGQLCAA